MARMPDAIDALTPEAQKVYDKIVAKRGKLRGPYAPLMHDPALAEPIADLGEYLRFKSTLPGDVREMAILVVARSASQPFEWWAHAPIARRESVDGMKRLASRLTWWPTRPHKSTPAVIAAVRRGQPWIILASTSTRGKARSVSWPRAGN